MWYYVLDLEVISDESLSQLKEMSAFEQEWVSPILEVYKKYKISNKYNILLGLNPLGQVVCRELYEEMDFETVLVINSPNFSMWNRYPTDVKPPVVPVHGMVKDNLMIIFGDVFIREFEWVSDLLFYLRGNVPTKHIIGMMTHDGSTCGQSVSTNGERLLRRMGIPLGRPDYYDGLTAQLISLSSISGFDSVVMFIEQSLGSEVIFQSDEFSVTEEDIHKACMLLEEGFHLKGHW